jgi:glycine/D-amino acid oxidase-like deaminating enzyme
VILLDRRGPLLGSTPASTALVQYEIDVPLPAAHSHTRPRALGAGLAPLASGGCDGRIICGGEDEEFADEDGRDPLIPTKRARLSAKVARLFPSVDPRPEFAWTGAFGTTRTGLPLIGKLPGHQRVHTVMGYGGNGIAFSRIAAEIVRADLTGATPRRTQRSSRSSRERPGRASPGVGGSSSREHDTKSQRGVARRSATVGAPRQVTRPLGDAISVHYRRTA